MKAWVKLQITGPLSNLSLNHTILPHSPKHANNMDLSQALCSVVAPRYTYVRRSLKAFFKVFCSYYKFSRNITVNVKSQAYLHTKMSTLHVILIPAWTLANHKNT